jgi:hypothetical protein
MKSLQVEVCFSSVYNAPWTARWYNPTITRKLEDEIKELRDWFPNTEFVAMEDMNSQSE